MTAEYQVTQPIDWGQNCWCYLAVYPADLLYGAAQAAVEQENDTVSLNL